MMWVSGADFFLKLIQLVFSLIIDIWFCYEGYGQGGTIEGTFDCVGVFI